MNNTKMNFPNHDEVYRQLITGPLPSNLSGFVFHGYMRGRKIYSRGGYRIRESLNKKQQVILSKRYIEHDVILTLFSLRYIKGKYLHQKHKVFSIEIKTTEGDMEQSFNDGPHSFEKYMGATNYFFIAVPGHLLPKLIELHKTHAKRKYIGIIDASSGSVVVMPKEQEVDENRMHNVLSHCMTNVENLVGHREDRGLFSLKEVGSVTGKDLFDQCAYIKGVLVHKNYYDYFD